VVSPVELAEFIRLDMIDDVAEIPWGVGLGIEVDEAKVVALMQQTGK